MSTVREKILSAKDISSKVVEVPEWDVTLEIRTITARERARLIRDVYNEDGEPDLELLYPHLLIASCYDTDGSLAFQAEDVAALNEHNGSVIERVAMIAMELSGFTKDAETAAGKDSKKTPSTVSSST